MAVKHILLPVPFPVDFLNPSLIYIHPHIQTDRLMGEWTDEQICNMCVLRDSKCEREKRERWSRETDIYIYIYIYIYI